MSSDPWVMYGGLYLFHEASAKQNKVLKISQMSPVDRQKMLSGIENSRCYQIFVQNDRKRTKKPSKILLETHPHPRGPFFKK